MDFAPRNNFSVVAEAIRHASIACAGQFAPIKINSTSEQSEGCSSSGVLMPPHDVAPDTGAAVRSFNLNARMSMAGWDGQGSAAR